MPKSNHCSLFHCLGFLILTGGVCSAQGRATTAAQSHDSVARTLQDTLVALERASWHAWKERDGRFFQAFLSDDHLDIHPTGVSQKAAVVAGVGSPACVVQSYAVDGFSMTRFDASTALLVYRAEQNTMCGGNAVPSPVWVGSLYVKRDGRWLNAVMQVTPMVRRSP